MPGYQILCSGSVLPDQYGYRLERPAASCTTTKPLVESRLHTILHVTSKAARRPSAKQDCNPAMIETIYVLRHGYRLNWVTQVWKSETGLPRDPPLAAYGHTQAAEVAGYFLSLPEDERPTAIFSSPYYRCLQTTKPISMALNVPIYVEHGLSEWYSPVELGTGLHPRPFPAHRLQDYFSEIDPSWSSIYYPSRKGEDVDQCHDRTEAVLYHLVNEVESRFEGQHKRILLVSHAATIIAVNRALLGDREAPMRIGCCTLSEFQRKTGEGTVPGGWDGVKIGDGSHMKEGAGRDWGFEDIILLGGKVINDEGQPGTEGELDDPVGLQLPVHVEGNARM
ncbi:histidine phosphatase superfamily [Irpex rosettiformis]|uniref:Histidine phosphatase superfamily n=1 Tax=Irpex rosettiformis TaxID=378272 RepID=A0ACB8ULG8_9APHY|nr:histidine phosphatase superfamily [Irpex rosettiformis]